MTHSSKIKAGIVGCGRVAVYHLMHLEARADVEIVALVDANLDAARTLAARFKIPRVYASVDELFDAETIHVLHILTPPGSHKDLALTAIDRGVHVLVEKPLALEFRDAQQVMERAAAKGVIVCPDFIQLFHPRMVQATELIESGKLGRVVSCECHFGLDLNMPELREARGLHWSYTLPGGVLQNYITHPLYLVMRWTGAARKIHVVPRSLGSLPQGLTDQLDILIDGESASAYVAVSMKAQPSPYSLRILCERGTILVDFSALRVLTSTHGALPRSLARILPTHALSMVRWTFANVWQTVRRRLLPYHGLAGLFDGLYRAVAGGGRPPVSPELALAVSKAERDVLEHAGKLHVDAADRASRQRAVSEKEHVLVTGAGGYVGRRVVARLVSDGYRVRALARPLSQIADLERLGVEIRFIDLRDTDAVARAVEGMDVIVHVAAAIRGSAEFMRESTVGGTNNIAAAAEKHGVRRVIYISSMAVYDFAVIGKGTVTADSPLEARAAERGTASAVKREAEDIALTHARNGGRWTILRPSLIFGNGRDALGLVGSRRGGMLICIGKPSTRMRLVHVDDVAAAVSLLVRSSESAGRVFTLSHPETITYRDFLRVLPPSVMQEVRPIYLRRWFMSTAALGVRTLNRLRGRSGGPSRRQIGYLFADVLVDSTPVQQLGWRPAAPLREQITAGLEG